MKYYKSPNDQPFGYESDGSQDYLIPPNYLPITEEEAIQLGLEWIKKTSSVPLPPEPA